MATAEDATIRRRTVNRNDLPMRKMIDVFSYRDEWYFHIWQEEQLSWAIVSLRDIMAFHSFQIPELTLTLELNGAEKFNITGRLNSRACLQYFVLFITCTTTRVLSRKGMLHAWLQNQSHVDHTLSSHVINGQLFTWFVCYPLRTLVQCGNLPRLLEIPKL